MLHLKARKYDISRKEKCCEPYKQYLTVISTYKIFYSIVKFSRQCISGSNHDTLVYSVLCTCKSLLSLLTTLKITKQMLSHLHLDYISETLRTCHFVCNQSFSYSALFICRSKNYEAVVKVTSNENHMKTSVSINKQHRQIMNAEN